MICSLCLKIKAIFPSFPYLKLCPHPAGKDNSVSGYSVLCTQAPADPASATSALPTQHLVPSENLTASAPTGTAKSILGHGLPQPGCASSVSCCRSWHGAGCCTCPEGCLHTDQSAAVSSSLGAKSPSRFVLGCKITEKQAGWAGREIFHLCSIHELQQPGEKQEQGRRSEVKSYLGACAVSFRESADPEALQEQLNKC